MNEVIVFTPAQLIGGILAICAGITCIITAVNAITNIIHKAQSPERTQNERIASLEARVTEHDEILRKQDRRLDILEEGNRITQRALLALLAHGIDGNDVDGMKIAKKELEDYLITR